MTLEHTKFSQQSVQSAMHPWYIQEEKEYMTESCTELGDNTTSQNNHKNDGKDVLQIGNNFANKIEDDFNSIALLEQKLSIGEERIGDPEDIDDAPIEAALRRIQLEAELGLDDDDEDDEEDLDDGIIRAIVQRACQAAKSSDTQGYRVTSDAVVETDVLGIELRSIQDLAAQH